MLKVCFCAKQVDGLTASRQILTSKKDSIKPPICSIYLYPSFVSYLYNYLMTLAQFLEVISLLSLRLQDLGQKNNKRNHTEAHRNRKKKMLLCSL